MNTPKYAPTANLLPKKPIFLFSVSASKSNLSMNGKHLSIILFRIMRNGEIKNNG